MKKIFHKLRLGGGGTGGFTMIELLVVIAVIGVLAVAVLSSLNPIEQINKGRDTKKRSNAAQLINAIDRFYAIHEVYPWAHTTYGDATIDNDDIFPSGAYTVNANGGYQIGGDGYVEPAAPTNNWVTGLSSTDEVKQSYVDQIQGTAQTNGMYVFKAAEAPNVDDSVFVCFYPSSKAFEQEAVDACVTRKDLLPTSACPQTQATYDAGTTYGLGATDELICLP